MYTYPIANTGEQLTAAEVHAILKSPTLISRRVAELANMRFIADLLLKGRFTAQGGGIVFDENGAVVMADRDAESIAPGAEYPMSTVQAMEMAIAKTRKWGEDGEVTDEAISRLQNQPLDKTLTGLVNKVVATVDGVAMGVINSRITHTFDATATPWDTGAHIVESILLAKASADEQNGVTGYDLNTVVLKPTQFARVQGYLLTSQMLPREAGNPVLSSGAINILGLTWAQSPYVTTPMLVDTDQLGGMADENLGGPGYAKAGNTYVETKVMRLDEIDAYRPRARRVTVPVVTDPNAGIKILNTGV